MLYPEDGHVVPIADRADDFDGGRQLCIVETCHHLIQHQEPGASGDGSCQFKKPLLVQVEITDKVVPSVSEADERERFTAYLECRLFLSMASRIAKESPKHHILKHGHRRKVPGSLLHHGDPHLPNAVGRVTGDILAGEPDRAASGYF